MVLKPHRDGARRISAHMTRLLALAETERGYRVPPIKLVWKMGRDAYMRYIAETGKNVRFCGIAISVDEHAIGIGLHEA